MRHHAILAILATAALLTAQQAVEPPPPSHEQANALAEAPRLLRLKHATFDSSAAEPSIRARAASRFASRRPASKIGRSIAGARLQKPAEP